MERHGNDKETLRQRFIKNRCMHGYPCNGFCPHCPKCCPQNLCACLEYLYDRHRNSTTYMAMVQKDYKVTRGEIFA